MKALERFSEFVSKTFAMWVLLFAALAFFCAKRFFLDCSVYHDITRYCYVWYGINNNGCRL